MVSTSLRAIATTMRMLRMSATMLWSALQCRAMTTKASHMNAMLARIRAVNTPPPDDSSIPFVVDGMPLGEVRPRIAKLFCESGVFAMQESSSSSSAAMTLNSAVAGTTCASRSKAVAKVTQDFCDRGIISGWRNEDFAIKARFDDESPVFLMERAAVPFLGALEYGVHINGLVQPSDDNAPLQMWMARRSFTKSKYPGYLDHIVAGGQPHGLSLYENVIKECEEEAGIPQQLVEAGLRPVGAISYKRYNPKSDTIERVVLFNYDLNLPDSFTPKVVDGEVHEFFRCEMLDLLDMMHLDCADPIKPNCYVVIIDCLIRHGFVSPDAPGYLDLINSLQLGACQ